MDYNELWDSYEELQGFITDKMNSLDTIADRYGENNEVMDEAMARFAYEILEEILTKSNNLIK